jgi:hypothetical protein
MKHFCRCGKPKDPKAELCKPCRAASRCVGRVLCRHCGCAPVAMPRGLCWPCFQDPAIRGKFPPKETKFARRGEGIEGDGRLPEPTDAYTVEEGGHYATEAKLQILSMRAERGEALFHPDDAQRCLA